ncbi:MAG: hypothetical protein EA412_04635 [Chitinophagaceae bacterium]|nr:MAG: hypothetical protein EA412_04635 [Chitinophagaceae bacterium]
MKKLISCFLFVSFSHFSLFAQDNVGIGTTTPDLSAILEIQSSDKGVLIPRVTTLQRNNINNPATGLFVYDTDFNQFWYFDGTQWVEAIGPAGPSGPAGIDGQDGNDGQDGVGIINAVVNFNGDLILTYSDNTTVNAGQVLGPQGPAGPQGTSGSDGQDGTDGVGIVSTTDNQNGTFTINYSDGSSFTTIDLTGQQGATGPTGQQGATGPQGPQGSTGPQGPAGQDGLLPNGTAAGNTTYWNGSQWVVNSSNIYNNGGNVGINNNNPAYRLHVGGRIKSDGITESSDERLKEDIETLQYALSKVMELRGVSYSWNKYAGDELAESGSKIGLIAQEVEKIIPEVVDTDNEGYKSIQYSVLVALLIEAIKEQQNDYNALRNDVDKIFAEIEKINSNQKHTKENQDKVSLK